MPAGACRSPSSPPSSRRPSGSPGGRTGAAGGRVGVGEDDPAGVVDEDSVGLAEGGEGGGAAVAVEAGGAGAGDGGDAPRRTVDATEAVVSGVGDEDVVRSVDRHRPGFVEGRLVGGAEVAVVAGGSGAGHGGDDAEAVDAPDPVGHGIGDVEVPVVVEGEAPGVVELGGGGRATITGRAALAGSRHRGDDAGRVDTADPVIVGVGHQEAAVGRGDDEAGPIEPGGYPRRRHR